MIIKILLSAAILFAASFQSLAAEKGAALQGLGCMGKCTDCHNLSKDEAKKLLKGEQFNITVDEVRPSKVKGMWEVKLTQFNKKIVVYIDFSKKHLVEGQIKFTQLEKIGEQEPLRKLDVKSIPLSDAIIMGDPNAPKKIIVFDDPDCPYCKMLHKDIKKSLLKRTDVAYYIKMYPLPIHPQAYAKAKAIVCSKSVQMLDDAFEGKALPEPGCETSVVDENIKLAQELELSGTPGIILPDGKVVPGYAPIDDILFLMDNPEKQNAKPEKKTEGKKAEGKKK